MTWRPVIPPPAPMSPVYAGGGMPKPATGGGGAAGPVFRAYQSSAQAVTAATATKLNFQTEVYDPDGVFASSRFTAATAGYHHFTAGAAVSSAFTANTVLSLYKNGIADIDGNQINSSTYRVIVTGDIYLGVGDYVEVYLYCNPGSTLVTGAHQTYFMGHTVR